MLNQYPNDEESNVQEMQPMPPGTFALDIDYSTIEH